MKEKASNRMQKSILYAYIQQERLRLHPHRLSSMDKVIKSQQLNGKLCNPSIFSALTLWLSVLLSSCTPYPDVGGYMLSLETYLEISKVIVIITHINRLYIASIYHIWKDFTTHYKQIILEQAV